MAKTDTFQLSVVTPEKIALESEVRFVALPAHDGEIGVLRNRAPLLVRLDAGALRFEREGSEESLYVDGGFAQMVANRLTVLTEEARTVAELDRAAAEEALRAARETKAVGEAAIEARDQAARRARAQLRLLGAART